MPSVFVPALTSIWRFLVIFSFWSHVVIAQQPTVQLSLDKLEIPEAGGNGIGLGLNQLNYPSCVIVDKEGNLFIEDTYNHRILKWAKGSNFGVTVDGGTGQGTDLIQENSSPPSILFGGLDTLVYEEKGSINYPVRVTNITSKPIEVEVDFSGTAINGIDYIIDNHKIKFNPGDSLKTILITPLNDDLVEGMESIIFSVKSATNVIFTNSSDTLWLSSDDRPAITNLSIDKLTVSEAGGKVTMEATLAHVHSRDVILSLKSGGMATNQKDYTCDFLGKSNLETFIEANQLDSKFNSIQHPQKLWIDSLNNLFISDTYDDQVLKIKSGIPEWEIAAGENSIGEEPNQLNRPIGIFVDLNGDLYIVDQNNLRVVKWESGAKSGVTVAGGNGMGNAANQLSWPNDVVVDQEGNIFISDTKNHRVQKWAPGAKEGVTIVDENSFGPESNPTFSPIGLALDRNGNLYVSSRHEVRKWERGSKEGILVAGGSIQGSRLEELSNPYGIFIDPHDNLFIADKDNNRIQMWTPGAKSGITVAGGYGFGIGPKQLANPSWIFVDSAGDLFIVEDGYPRITKINPHPQIVIPAGKTTGKIDFLIIDDQNFEDTESVTWEISRVENAILNVNQTAGRFLITDNDSPPQVWLSSSDSTLNEEGPSIDLIVGLSATAEKNTQVNLAFSGSATLGTDYIVDNQEVLFFPGDSVKKVKIIPINNQVVEGLKFVTVEVLSGTNIAAPFPKFSIQLSSDDQPTVSLSIDRLVISEVDKKEAILTATLSSPHSRDVVIYLDESGSAVYDSDYKLNFGRKGLAQTVAGGNGEGTRLNQLYSPMDIIVDSLGSVLITDYWTGAILKWKKNAQAGEIYKKGQMPHSIFLDSLGVLYVSEALYGVVTKWFPGAKERVLVAGSYPWTSNSATLFWPSSISVDKKGNLFIVEEKNVIKWDIRLNKGTTIFNSSYFISDIFVDQFDDLYIAEEISNKIYKWSKQTNSFQVFVDGSGNVIEASQFGGISSIFIDKKENLYIADAGNLRIQKLPKGAIESVKVAGGNGRGSGMNQLDYPQSIYLDNEGDIFVLDANNFRVQKFFISPQIVIPAGQLKGTLEIQGIEDHVVEQDEHIVLKVSKIENGLMNPSRSSVQVTLVDHSFNLVKQEKSVIPPLENTALSWGDFDQDGDQDLAILGYSKTKGAITRVYRNDKGNFVDTHLPFVKFISGDIKWTDINKDGFLDLLISGISAVDDKRSEPKTILYISQGGKSFEVAPNLGVDRLTSSKFALGDLDNDGDADLAIYGNEFGYFNFNVYKNEGEGTIFSRVKGLYKDLSGPSNDWDIKIADFDLDGDNDILHKGRSSIFNYNDNGYVNNKLNPSGEFYYGLNFLGLRYGVAKILNNEQSLQIIGIGEENKKPIVKSNNFKITFEGDYPELKDGSIAIGDYNNDGLHDIFFTGRDENNIPRTIVYRQTKRKMRYDRVFFQIDRNQNISGLYNSTADWVDYDVDGDLDLVMTGLDENNIQQIYFYKNIGWNKQNIPPLPPTNLSATSNYDGTVDFKWDKPKDDHSTFLGYNIRIGTTPGGTELTYTLSNLATGSPLINTVPSIYKESYTTQLSPGRYYWSVQAIDQGYRASEFALEGVLDVVSDWNLINYDDIVRRSISQDYNAQSLLLDLDNDQDLDLVYGSRNSVKIYLNEEMKFIEKDYMFALGGMENMESGDFNNDGLSDIVINHYNSFFSVYLNTGSDFSRHDLLIPRGLENTTIKIVDMNNNGRKEIILAGMTTVFGDTLSKLYSFEWNQESSSFLINDESTKIASMKNALFDFGDFNRDGKVDIILSGIGDLGPQTLLYQNQTVPGESLNLKLTLFDFPGITNGTVNFIDYDSDGDEDLIFTGKSKTGNLFQLYSNEINHGAGFVSKPTNLEPLGNARLRFGDFNNDGYTDIFYGGTVVGVERDTSMLAYYNPSLKVFENSDFVFENLTDVKVSFGDLDVDGDLDAMVIGYAIKYNGPLGVRFYLNVRNESALVEALGAQENQPNVVQSSLQNSREATNISGSRYLINSPPQAPLPKSLTSVEDNATKLLRFEWNPATDDHTPSQGLTYSLRVGTTPTNDRILSAHANSNSVLKIPSIGNVSTSTAWNLQMLPDGEYYWSVQAIDASFIGSIFSNPQKFTIQNGEILTVPNQPGDFLSSHPVICPNTSFTYTLPSAEAGATYEWGFLETNPQARITSTTATSATVFFEAGFSQATLTVLARNAFGDSPKRSLEIRKGALPEVPGTIQASQSVVCPNSTRSYAVSPVNGAVSYDWSYSGTGTSFSSGGTSIRVSYGASATSGSWQVRAVGACGRSEPRTLPIEVIPQQQVIPGRLVIEPSVRKVEKATQSITLVPSATKPILIEPGAVFSAQIVGCPVE